MKNIILNISTEEPNIFESGESKYLGQFEEKLQYIEKQLAVIKKFSDKDSIQESTKQINELVSAYKTKFYYVVEAKIKKGFKDWGKICALRQSVHEVETKLASLENQEKLTINMLMNRRHEKDYLLRNDVKYQDKIAKRVTEFEQLLITSNLDTETKSD